MSQVRKDILNGWKEIANYVGRDLRTVERWEKQRGLPIRRLPGSGRATVYARIEELDKWFASAQSQDNDEPGSEPTADPALAPATAVASLTLSDEAIPEVTFPTLREIEIEDLPMPAAVVTPTNIRYTSRWSIAAVMAIAAAGILGWMLTHGGRTMARSGEARPVGATVSMRPAPLRVFRTNRSCRV